MNKEIRDGFVSIRSEIQNIKLEISEIKNLLIGTFDNPEGVIAQHNKRICSLENVKARVYWAIGILFITGVSIMTSLFLKCI